MSSEASSSGGSRASTGNQRDSGLAVVALDNVEGRGMDEIALDESRKAVLSHYTRTKLFESGYPVINNDTYKAVPSLLREASECLGIQGAEFILYRSSLKKVISEKLNNCRSHLKKKARQLFKGRKGVL